MTEMIAENVVVAIQYELTDKTGAVLDSSDGEPLEYLHGHQNIIVGLEKALNGLKPGDKKKVEVSPEEGYGAYKPEMAFSVGLDQFEGDVPEEGLMVQLASEQGGSFVARVVSIQGNEVQLDANHPLAGKDLFFDVEVVQLRPASAEELAHGHPHGPHGHHH
ncbi:MAG: peptidylprolyl isomerase [Cyanobacteria bacterium]|nr:peptidylprolyl isomerase [Cyanobacteriota bacterium]